MGPNRIACTAYCALERSKNLRNLLWHYPLGPFSRICTTGLQPTPDHLTMKSQMPNLTGYQGLIQRRWASQLQLLPLFTAKISLAVSLSDSEIRLHTFHRVFHAYSYVLSHRFRRLFRRTAKQDFDETLVTPRRSFIRRFSPNAIPRGCECVRFFDRKTERRAARSLGNAAM